MDFMKTKPSAKKGFQEGNTHTNPRPAKMLVLQNLVWKPKLYAIIMENKVTLASIVGWIRN